MSEFITIQVGQCGNQIGSAFWPLVLQEYNITKSPSIPLTRKYEFRPAFRSFFTVPDGRISNFETFADLKAAKVKARTILIDMEDGVVSRIKNGPMKFLFDEKSMVINYPGSGNNWAEGFCYHGPAYKDEIISVIRRNAERCDNLHGFLVMFSTGGGTGSGVGSYVLKLLADHYPLIDRFAVCVYPIGTEDVITCPYNMALCTKQLNDFADCVFPVENRALLEIVNKQTKNVHSMDTIRFIARCKPFQDLNSIIVNMLLHLTSGSRFPGDLNVDLNEINTNMVPFPKMQFIASSFSPLTMSSSETLSKQLTKQAKDHLLLTVCDRKNHLLKIDCVGVNSILLGSTLIGRGNYTVSDMRAYVERLQKKATFRSWSRKAIKVGLCDIAPLGQDASLLALFNTTGMATLFSNINKHFTRIYEKKAHIHHYVNITGFDRLYFEECQENLLNNINSYRELEFGQSDSVPRLSVLVE